jgi:dUTP pyrophosphatase
MDTDWFKKFESLKRYNVDGKHYEVNMSDWFKDNAPKSLLPTLKVVNNSDNPNPTFGTDGSSGMDLRANLGEENTMVAEPMGRGIVPTGIHFGIPKGFEIQVRSRSGLALNHGIMVLNSPGTVDQDYTGEVKVILINLGTEAFTINHGDRIAQAVLCPVMQKQSFNIEETKSLETTVRGEGGFGSTGKK